MLSYIALLSVLLLGCLSKANARSLPSALFDENIYARIWRTALTGPPYINDTVGWPQYTQGAYGNTPASNITPGVYVNTAPSGWTAGFFSNMLWQSYKRRKSLQPSVNYQDEPSLDSWLQQARAWTDPLIANVNLTNTHDIGFLSFPFASAMELDPDETRAQSWLPVLQQMSDNLASRYVPKAGVIRSWNTNNNSFAMRGSHSDSVLVIIDNMMNLALLARSAQEYTGNETLLAIAIAHANRTRDHHIRPDGSSFHVCDYSAITGELYLCRTAQGLADNSTWARGQAWAIYGFAQMYSFTQDESYLATALKCADWFLDHLPNDGVPFWDFDAPQDPDETPRDTSAATITGSGMLLLQEQMNNCRLEVTRNYETAAVKLLQNTIDLALAGEIGFADSDPSDLGALTELTTPANTSVSSGLESILMHATANNNPQTVASGGGQWDIGLVYGDAYLIEAGNRLLEQKKKQN